ncbi:hypothetical protein HMPREF1982_03531 [Clostridiales bacterium oral taxon 876 str. F0540]|nr:hypothetical protein HMPREF1982_03531 [Clostridiales bacterium oral taxon 876 str. F0540]
MCKVIQFPKQYNESQEGMDKLYEMYYSDPANYMLDPNEWDDFLKDFNNKHKKTM